MDPKVTVILPNYNHARFLQKRVDSILEQTYPYYELIILDDCSTDNSKAIIEQYRNYPCVKEIVYNEQNSGTTFKQWQKGLAVATGEWIWIAESDDYCDALFLETAIAHVIDRPGINVFFTRSYEVDENNQIISNTLQWSADRPLYKWDSNFEEEGKVFIERCMVQSNIIVNASGVLFRKSAVPNAIFPIITSLRKTGDWLFWVVCLLQGKVAYHGVEPLNYFRTHQQSTRHLTNLDAVLLQKVEKYFVLTEIQQLLPEADLQLWVRKAYLEMIMMTPVKNYRVLQNTLHKVTGGSMTASAFWYSKLRYLVQTKMGFGSH